MSTASTQLPKRKHDGKPYVSGNSREMQRCHTMQDTANDAAESAELRQQINELESLADIREQLDEWTRVAVGEARRNGHSWTTIGNALGVTKQAVSQRYGRTA